MNLPSVPLAPGGHWLGRLRVGLVLHEFAHVMVMADAAFDSPVISEDYLHGRVLTDALDRLIAAWRASSPVPCEPSASVSAEAVA